MVMHDLIKYVYRTSELGKYTTFVKAFLLYELFGSTEGGKLMM
jgi:hypothetical protein